VIVNQDDEISPRKRHPSPLPFCLFRSVAGGHNQPYCSISANAVDQFVGVDAGYSQDFLRESIRDRSVSVGVPDSASCFANTARSLLQTQSSARIRSKARSLSQNCRGLSRFCPGRRSRAPTEGWSGLSPSLRRLWDRH
jgi:hypothetical protein